jgi:predicted nucleic acid-binding Zn ribbon protein
MAISKYICRCGNRTDKLTSYFIGGIRVTACEECEGEFKNIKDAVAIDYDEVKKDQSKQVIDTREK